MAALRCNNCVYLKQGFCSRIGEALPNRLTKLFYGGAEDIYSGTMTYPSECGIETEKVNEEDLDLLVLIPENHGDEMLEHVNASHGET